MAIAPAAFASQAQATPPKEATPPAVSGTSEEQKLLGLSRQKWLWMSERNVDALAALFHEKAVFVHMGGTMTRDQELGVIKGGGIHYKHAEILESSVRFVDDGRRPEPHPAGRRGRRKRGHQSLHGHGGVRAGGRGSQARRARVHQAADALAFAGSTSGLTWGSGPARRPQGLSKRR